MNRARQPGLGRENTPLTRSVEDMSINTGGGPCAMWGGICMVSGSSSWASRPATAWDAKAPPPGAALGSPLSPAAGHVDRGPPAGLSCRPPGAPSGGSRPHLHRSSPGFAPVRTPGANIDHLWFTAGEPLGLWTAMAAFWTWTKAPDSSRCVTSAPLCAVHTPPQTAPAAGGSITLTTGIAGPAPVPAGLRASICARSSR